MALTSNQIIKDNDECNKFYCSIDGCIFSKGMGKFFKRKMLADQHYLNSHSEKKHICPNCSKAYSIDWQLKYHLKTCGILWQCSSCSKAYKERLSLVTHCKRHSHVLPESARMRKIKDRINNEKAINLIILPLIISPNITNSMATMTATTETQVKLNEAKLNSINSSRIKSNLPRPILPKPVNNDLDQTAKSIDVSVQTEKLHCNCKRKLVKQDSHTSTSNKTQIATQTERTANKHSRASKGAQCPPLRAKPRKRRTSFNYESIETQTLESTFTTYMNNTLANTSTKSTSTIQLSSQFNEADMNQTSETLINTNISNSVNNNNDDCIVTAIESSITTINSSNNENEIKDATLLGILNPLLAQYQNVYQCQNSVSVNTENDFDHIDDNNNCYSTINEQSVQTEDISNLFNSEFNNIETQTSEDYLTNENDLLNISAADLAAMMTNDDNGDIFFNEMELTDIETQTIWNNDETTQTDDNQLQCLNVLDYVLNDNKSSNCLH